MTKKQRKSANDKSQSSPQPRPPLRSVANKSSSNVPRMPQSAGHDAPGIGLPSTASRLFPQPALHKSRTTRYPLQKALTAAFRSGERERQRNIPRPIPVLPHLSHLTSLDFKHCISRIRPPSIIPNHLHPSRYLRKLQEELVLVSHQK